MRFNKTIPEDLQKVLTKQLKEYEHCFKDMSKKERRLLHEWVKNGNSPYKNGDFVCDDNCKPMDFVSTLRFWADMREYYDSLTEEEKKEFTGESRELTRIPDYDGDRDGFYIPPFLLEKIEKEVSL